MKAVDDLTDLQAKKEKNTVKKVKKEKTTERVVKKEKKESKTKEPRKGSGV